MIYLFQDHLLLFIFIKLRKNMFLYQELSKEEIKILRSIYEDSALLKELNSDENKEINENIDDEVFVELFAKLFPSERIQNLNSLEKLYSGNYDLNNEEVKE